MRRAIPGCLVVLLAWAVGLLPARPARAGWTDFVPVGNTAILSDISCASPATGTAVCAGIGPDQRFYSIAYRKGTWGAWLPLGTVIASAPSCATALATGSAVCAVAKPSVGTLAFDLSGADDLTVNNLGLLPTAPSCVSVAAGRVFCAAGTLTTSGATVLHGVVGVTYDLAANMALATTRLAGEATYSQIGCAPDGKGGAVCAWNGAANHVITRRYLGQPFPPPAGRPLPWSNELDLEGLAVSPPQCIYSGVPGTVGCAAISSDTTLYGIQWSGGAFTLANWNDWEEIATPVTGFGCAGLGAVGGKPSYVCGVINANDNRFATCVNIGLGWPGCVEHTGYYVGNSVKKVYEPGDFIGNPTCFTIDTTVVPAQVMCVVRLYDLTQMSTIGP